MPINPVDYPPDWPLISHRIRFARAEGRCECMGECGSRPHVHWIKQQSEWGTDVVRCPNIHNEPARHNSGTKVILTTAHLNQNPASDDDDQLRAMCQSCHFAYDKQPEQVALRAEWKLLASRNGRGIGERATGADERQDPGEHA